MLIKEYSLDPELFAEPDVVKRFIRDFGLDKGRILSLVPKGWIKLAADNLAGLKDIKDRKQAEIILSTLQKWKMQRVAYRSPARKDASYTDPWIEYVSGFTSNPFDGVITFKSVEQGISPNDFLYADPEGWKIEHTQTVKITAEEVIPCLERAFTLSEVIYLIDPYFNLEDGKVWPFWDAFVRVMEENPHIKQFIILTADNKAPSQILGRNSKRLDAMRDCEIWQVVNKEETAGFHDRLVLTDYVGFNLSNSLQEKPNEFMDISRLSMQSYEQRKNQYIVNCSKNFKQIY